jgi:Leucine-rich repeat (LRR) protein
LKGLEELWLDDNLITFIDNATFAPLKKLRKLSLTGNRRLNTELILPGAFVTESGSGALPLEELSLKGTSFTSVPTNLFRWLSNLKSLDLSQTSISVLHSDAFRYLSGLVNLTLDSLDQLTTIKPGAFRSLNNLETLRLTNNKLLSNISYGAFLDLPGLRHLDLRYNGLQSLLASAANWSAIDLVDLRGNPFRLACFFFLSAFPLLQL